jgi:hypothetical protein
VKSGKNPAGDNRTIWSNGCTAWPGSGTFSFSLFVKSAVTGQTA